MTEHLEIERISALLDEPWSDLDAEGHLEACEDCRLEFERLSRMRMAFSGLGELEAPRDEWARIEASLDDVLGPEESDVVPITGRRPLARRLMSNGPLQAAAAVALFAGGVFAGLQFTSGGGTSAVNGPVVTGQVPAVIPASGEDRELYDVLSDLESMQTPLRQVGAGGPDAAMVPADLDAYEAARAAARLDGIIQALRERLNESPGDPLASGYLPWALDQRALLAEVLEQSARNSSVVEW